MRSLIKKTRTVPFRIQAKVRGNKSPFRRKFTTEAKEKMNSKCDRNKIIKNATETVLITVERNKMRQDLNCESPPSTGIGIIELKTENGNQETMKVP